MWERPVGIDLNQFVIGRAYPGTSKREKSNEPSKSHGAEGRIAMRIDTLEAYNVPPDIIDVWRTHVGPELLPVQERAVKEFGLFGSDNLIVFSPTSSGKTFIGEMAAVK